MAPGLPLSQQDPHPGLWFGKAAQLFLILSYSQPRPKGWGTEASGELGEARGGAFTCHPLRSPLLGQRFHDNIKVRLQSEYFYPL